MKFKLQEHVDLAELTTFKIGGAARYFTEVTEADQLPDVFTWLEQEKLPYFVLSGGSNTIFDDGEFGGLVIKIDIKGFGIVKEDGQSTTIEIGAGENWDETVKKTVEMGLSGIEALSGIPGLAGTAPVQNIGAYGQEIASTLEYLYAFDTKELQDAHISHYNCQFGYRDSIFKSKQKGRYIITSIFLSLSKGFDGVPNYPDVTRYFEQHEDILPSLESVRQAVLEIRKAKFANPADKPNAGSFFKNPIVGQPVVQKLQSEHPQIKLFPYEGSRYKISAGWLIENCDLKGYKKGPIQVDPKHALVLENLGGATQKELKEFVGIIQKAVKTKFGIQLDPEPEIVNFSSVSLIDRK